jgi:hypothetical protein
MHPDPENLTALAYGLITGPEREELLEHLSECDDCRALYDSYREESRLVGRAVLTDAHNELANARALERTLLALESAAEDASEKPQGRVVRMPLWAKLSQVAALLVLCAGLLLVFSNRGEDGDTGVIPVAQERRAPASVQDGVVYVPDHEGDWKQAEAVPLDEWVKAGEGSLVLRLVDGSEARLSGNAVFRVALDFPGEGGPVVQILHGDGHILGNESRVKVQTGNFTFHTLPGSELNISCVAEQELLQDARNLRTWTLPRGFNANVGVGDVVFSSNVRDMLVDWPMQLGESIEWNEQGLVGRRASGDLLPLTGRAADADTNELHVEWMDRINKLVGRHPALGAKLSNLNHDSARNTFFLQLHEDATGSFQLPGTPQGGTVATSRISWGTDGRQLSATWREGNITVTVRHDQQVHHLRAAGVDELKAEAPDHIRLYLQGLTEITDQEGQVIGIRYRR